MVLLDSLFNSTYTCIALPLSYIFILEIFFYIGNKMDSLSYDYSFLFNFYFQVTPKLPGLNPNATVFLSHKTSPQGEGQTTDTGQWDSQNDSGIANSTHSGK